SSPGLSDLNTLLLSNIVVNTSLHVLDDFTLTSGGALRSDGAGLTVGPSGPPPTTADNGSFLQIDGPAYFNSGTLDASHAFRTWIGRDQDGSFSINNGQLNAHALTVGAFAQGTANFLNSTSHLGYTFGIANVGYSITQNVAIVGGQFTATNTFFSP